MYTVKKDLSFIKKIFKENLKKYIQYCKRSIEVEMDETIWSNEFIDFFPFESVLEGYKQAKIYKTKPIENESLVMNQLKNNKLFYSYKYLNKDWGSIFYVENEQDEIRLLFNNQNEDDKMLLSQITYKVMQADSVQKILFYMFDKDMDEESAYLYDHFYDEKQKLNKIIRYDLLDSDNTITYSFQYTDEICNIVQSWTDSKGILTEKQIYPTKSK